MSKTIAKTWNGRKVAKETVIACSPNVEFGALYEAESILKKDGYFCGWLDGGNPIGISFNEPVFKWHSLSKEDKSKLDGVLVSDNFRNGDVKIIFFES